MNVDTGARVSPLGHHARQKRNFFKVEQMRATLDRHRFQKRIGENNFLITDRRRIALVGGDNVRAEQLPNAGK